MTELLELAALFVVIYLLDCGAVVSRRAVGFVRSFGRWRARRVFSPNAAWSQGALWGEPLPPLAPLLVSEPLPVALSAEGIAVLGPELTLVPWAESSRLSIVDGAIRLDGEFAAVIATTVGRGVVERALAELPALAPDARAAAITRILDASFDHTAIAGRLERFRSDTRFLAFFTNLLWIGLFGGLVALVRWPLLVIVLSALAVVAFAWLGTIVALEQAFRRVALAPSSRPSIGKRILVGLTPMSAIRGRDLLARELVGDRDPLAVAASLLPPSALAALARPRLVELRFGPAATRVSGWCEGVARRIERLLTDRGVDVASLLAPPPRESPDVRSWCPSCRSQYLDETASACREARCAGVRLLPFESAAR